MAIDNYLKTYKYRHTDWSGGMRDDVRGTLLESNQSQILKDVTLDQKGTLYPCPGHLKRYKDNLSQSIDGLGYFEKYSSRLLLMVAIGNVLYYDDLLAETPTLTSLATGLAASSFWRFVEFGDSIYITNGKDALRKWNGLDASPTTVAPTYTFSDLAVHDNRLWGVEAGTSRLRFSNILDGSKWDALDFIDFSTSDADRIRKIMHYQSYLVVFKGHRKAMLTGDTTANYSIIWLDTYGIVGVHSAEIADRYLVYASLDGIHLTDLTTDTLISESLRTSWITRVSSAFLSKIAITYWRNYILVSLPVDGSSVNNEVWCYDLRYRSWVVLTGLNIACWVKGNIPN